jgi:hypothetical protein
VTRGEYSVVQFFPNRQYEKYVEFVDAATALSKALALVNSVGGRLGTTQRVIITDGGDSIAWEWKFGEGVVFPVEAKNAG